MWVDGREWLERMHDQRYGEEQKLAECPAEVVPLHLGRNQSWVKLECNGMGILVRGKWNECGSLQVRVAPPRYEGEALDTNNAIQAPTLFLFQNGHIYHSYMTRNRVNAPYKRRPSYSSVRLGLCKATKPLRLRRTSTVQHRSSYVLVEQVLSHGW